MNTNGTTQYWLADRTLEALHRLNGSALELLYDEARLATPLRLPFRLRIPARDLLARSSPAQRWAAARVPILLANVRFQDAEWWAHVEQPLFRAAGVPHLRRQPHARRVLALHRSVLSFAWHIAQHDRAGAEILLGMHDRVASALSHLTPLDLERLADGTVLELLPRWMDQRSMWSQLLDNPREDGVARLAHIRSVQMLGALESTP